jgi:hypothetical protein
MLRPVPLFVLLCVLTIVGLASAQPKTITIPFHEINHRILIDVRIDGKPSTLLFDTGARVSVFQSCSLILIPANEKLKLACSDESIGVAFVAPEKGVRFDGFLGADLLSKFSSVRIDYHNRVIELEK